MKSTRILLLVLMLLLLAVGTLFTNWLLKDKKKMNMLVLNKTVPHKSMNEHKTFFWVLNNDRYTKYNGSSYKPDKDYYGFFPLKTKKEKEYYIKSIRLTNLDSLVKAYDAMFCIDAYGVFYADWYRGLSNTVNSTLIYGGLNQNDYYLLRDMKEAQKLVMVEYHTLGEPTNPLIRHKTQNLFDFSWTGWTGKYFKSLDVKDSEVPQWIINKFTAANNKKWPYKKSGIVFYNNNKIIVLEDGVHLNAAFPVVETQLDYQNSYSLPAQIPFTGWFNVIETSLNNQIMATLKVPVTGAGEKAMLKAGIPQDFPFVIYHTMDYLFYYFAGDISDNNIPYFTFPFMAYEKLQRIFYSRDPDDPKRFFWEYYKPLMSGILNDYYQYHLPLQQ